MLIFIDTYGIHAILLEYRTDILTFFSLSYKLHSSCMGNIKRRPHPNITSLKPYKITFTQKIHEAR
jgi:hypothetical protein